MYSFQVHDNDGFLLDTVSKPSLFEAMKERRRIGELGRIHGWTVSTINMTK
jgi:hypothetical protein